MPDRTTFHASVGQDFLGFRKTRQGITEIVYDDGRRHRMVWRVRSATPDGAIGEALDRAVHQPRVLPALFAELKKRSIAIEAVTA
ncbi:MAG: hypothetical protein N2422_02575 [Rhodobacteraceae bacterium]|nr:hypothetical protein [Paracoccaceae bacterium]